MGGKNHEVEGRVADTDVGAKGSGLMTRASSVCMKNRCATRGQNS